MVEASIKPQPRKAAGRPRRITLDAVVEAACDLGIDSFEMTAVAERLGIGVATLYGYVEHRDHLVSLAAARASKRKPIVDQGQSWQDVVREHAAITYEIYLTWPQLVAQTMSATVGSHVEVLALEGVLALLIDKGLPPEDAANLYYGVNQVVVGAAVGVAYLRAIEAREGSYDALVQRMLDERGDELPAIQKCAVVPGAPSAIGDYRTVLEAMLRAQEDKLAQG